MIDETKRHKFSGIAGYLGLIISVFTLFVVASASGLTPCAYAQSTICNDADLHVFGSGIVVNEDGGTTANDNFRVESGTDSDLIDTDTSTDQIAIGQDASTNVVGFEVGITSHFKAATEIDSVNIDGGTIDGITDLAVVDGGTGVGTFTDGGVVIGNSTNALQVTTAGTAGEVLTSNGAGVDPSFQSVVGVVATYNHKTSIQSKTTDTTLADVSDLTFLADSNDVYVYSGLIIVSASTTGALKINIGTGGGSGDFNCLVSNHNSNTISEFDESDGSLSLVVTNAAIDPFLIHCTIDAGASGGVTGLEFAQSVSDGTATSIWPDSYMMFVKIEDN